MLQRPYHFLETKFLSKLISEYFSIPISLLFFPHQNIRTLRIHSATTVCGHTRDYVKRSRSHRLNWATTVTQEKSSNLWYCLNVIISSITSVTRTIIRSYMSLSMTSKSCKYSLPLARSRIQENVDRWFNFFCFCIYQHRNCRKSLVVVESLLQQQYLVTNIWCGQGLWIYTLILIRQLFQIES